MWDVTVRGGGRECRSWPEDRARPSLSCLCLVQTRTWGSLYKIEKVGRYVELWRALIREGKPREQVEVCMARRWIGTPPHKHTPPCSPAPPPSSLVLEYGSEDLWFSLLFRDVFRGNKSWMIIKLEPTSLYPVMLCVWRTYGLGTWVHVFQPRQRLRWLVCP